VLNKADLLASPAVAFSEGAPDGAARKESLFVSSQNGAGLDRLLERIQECLAGAVAETPSSYSELPPQP
jgi:50S ribosomal subunit-associated GTPase HflX